MRASCAAQAAASSTRRGKQLDVEAELARPQVAPLFLPRQQIDEQRREPGVGEHARDVAVAGAEPARTRAVREEDEAVRAVRDDEAPRRPARIDLLLERQGQLAPHVVVRELAEVVVPEADRVERLGGDQGDDLVGLDREHLERVRRRGRHGDDEPPRTAAAHRLGRRPHRRPGGETVVDEHDHAVAQVGRRAVAAVRPLAALELDPLPLRHLLDHVVAEAAAPGRAAR